MEMLYIVSVTVRAVPRRCAGAPMICSGGSQGGEHLMQRAHGAEIWPLMTTKQLCLP